MILIVNKTNKFHIRVRRALSYLITWFSCRSGKYRSSHKQNSGCLMPFFSGSNSKTMVSNETARLMISFVNQLSPVRLKGKRKSSNKQKFRTTSMIAMARGFTVRQKTRTECLWLARTWTPAETMCSSTVKGPSMAQISTAVALRMLRSLKAPLVIWIAKSLAMWSTSRPPSVSATTDFSREIVRMHPHYAPNGRVQYAQVKTAPDTVFKGLPAYLRWSRSALLLLWDQGLEHLLDDPAKVFR